MGSSCASAGWRLASWFDAAHLGDSYPLDYYIDDDHKLAKRGVNDAKGLFFACHNAFQLAAVLTNEAPQSTNSF